VSGKLVNTTSERSATSADFPRRTRLAYQFFYFLPRAIVHDQWETALSKFCAIGFPIKPKPIYPKRKVLIIFSFALIISLPALKCLC
jgi:hypothetical protein